MGKKIAKIRTYPRHVHPQTIGVTHPLENLKDQRWDPTITGSGQRADKNSRFPGASVGNALEGYGHNRDKDDKSNTLRAKQGLPRCVSAVSVTGFMSLRKFRPAKDIQRTPAHPFSGRANRDFQRERG